MAQRTTTAPYSRSPARGVAVARPAANTSTEFANSICRIIRKLVAELVRAFPRDATVDRVKKRLFLATDSCPIFVAETVGAYLFPYRAEVWSHDEGFFLENSYDQELRAAVSTEKVDYVEYIMPLVKNLWRAGTTPEDVKQDCRESVSRILDLYIEYLVAKGGQ